MRHEAGGERENTGPWPFNSIFMILGVLPLPPCHPPVCVQRTDRPSEPIDGFINYSYGMGDYYQYFLFAL